jgi:hypothetical protein
VAIRASSSKQIDALIAQLASDDGDARESAVARLTVIGARAVERLLAAARSEGAPAPRVTAWRTLEAIGDARALEPALAALDGHEPSVAAAAAATARRFVRGASGARVVDRLTAAVLDRRRPDVVRAAALRALSDLDPATTAPLLRSLADDPSNLLRDAANGMPTIGHDTASRARRRERAAADAAGPTVSDAVSPREREAFNRASAAARLASAADQVLPGDPDALRTDLANAGFDTPVALLARLVDRIREHEGAERPAARQRWTLARAAAHLALARRGSRLALYDLRETLESGSGPLPVGMLQALVLVGDAASLAAIATAHAKAQDEWSRGHLADAFYAIVERERLTARQAAAVWAGASRKATRAGKAGRARKAGKSK